MNTRTEHEFYGSRELSANATLPHKTSTPLLSLPPLSPSTNSLIMFLPRAVCAVGYWSFFTGEGVLRFEGMRHTGDRGGGGGLYSQFAYGRSRMAINPGIPTMPGRTTSGFPRPSRQRGGGGGSTPAGCGCEPVELLLHSP